MTIFKKTFKIKKLAMALVLLLVGQTAWGQGDSTMPVIKSSKFLQSLLETKIETETIETKTPKPTLDEQIAHYQAQATVQNLAKDPTWQRLLYINGAVSDVQYAQFFLNDDGKNNPQAELTTTIARLFGDTDENSPQCRFPARSEWLINKLNIQKNQLPSVDCSEFERWFATINPHTLTLVFASDYMGNPSSMFGHTLIRLDPPKSNQNKDLLAYALNYAAIPPANESSAMYAYKGLTGGYGGQYSLMKYFHKTREYGGLESRDMWEYELDLTAQEVQFLVKHIWEMRGVSFPYYFMDKNCSYALMGLIDLVRPDLNLQSQFGFTVIPIETVKAIKKAGLVKSVNYRPALETALKTQEKHYGKDFANTAYAIANSPAPSDLLKKYATDEQAKLLEMAYDMVYFNQSAQTMDKEFAKKQLLALLTLRSQLDIPKQSPTPPRPTDPADGHGARAIGLSMGQVQGDDGVHISYRTAYHGLSDPQDGYHAGQLLFLNGAVQVTKDKVKLEQLDILSVKSVNAITSYKRPKSWGVDIGYRQVAVDNAGKFDPKQRHGVATLAMQTGYSKTWDNLTCGAYAQAKLQAGRVFEHSVGARVSPVIECQWGQGKWQGVASVSAPIWQTGDNLLNLAGELHYTISPNRTIGVSGEYEGRGNAHWHKAMVGYRWYF